MGVAVHTAHVLAAGIWLGGLVFTYAVVSPALAAAGWSDAERVGARSRIGRRYARVAGANLAALAALALLDGLLRGLGAPLLAEYALLALVLALAGIHGAYFGRRLEELARAERTAGDGRRAREAADRRRALQRLSLRTSQLDLLASAALLALAINA